MKKILIAAAASMTLAGMAAPAFAADYLPFGPQTNVAISTVTSGGWSLCYSSPYATPVGTTYDALLSGCSGSGALMLAGGLTGSDSLLVLAQADYADVTFVTGSGNTTHNANGSEWYYESGFGSWGFALGGDSVNRGICDVESANGADRLCWHVVDFTGGYRAGNVTGLNGSLDYTKYIFQFTGGGAVPEPATWALMIGGFGMAGAALRRRRAVAA